jgi:alkylation response protein AidB-like acyl-CoA dehydrogenase
LKLTLAYPYFNIGASKMISHFRHFRKYVKIEKLFRVPKVHLGHNISQSESSLFNPTEEHLSLRNMVKSFVEKKVDPQATEYNKHEKFNLALFRELGDLGLLGITVETQYGGSGMDATAAVIVHEELSASDPALTLAYLAHSILFVNNLAQNGTEDQKMKYLPGE